MGGVIEGFFRLKNKQKTRKTQIIPLIFVNEKRWQTEERYICTYFILTWDYLNLSLPNEYVVDVTVPTQGYKV